MNVEAVERLRGRRVLVVEDDPIAAGPVCEDLRGNGITVLGPAPTVHYAGLLLLGRGVDAAVLDVRLYGGMVYELAEELILRRVPFVFISGMPRGTVPRRFRDVAWLEKPVGPAALLAALANGLDAEPSAMAAPAPPRPRAPLPQMRPMDRRGGRDRWWRAIAHGFLR